MGWPPGAAWVGGLMDIIRCVHTKRWIMRRRRKCTLIPERTEPSRPDGKRCGPRKTERIALLDSKTGRIKRLDIRPPAAVNRGTLRKGRGRTGGARHGSFSLFQRVLKHGMNDSQTNIEMTTGRGRPSYFLRSVV
jgi:hypothetical protein